MPPSCHVLERGVFVWGEVKGPGGIVNGLTFTKQGSDGADSTVLSAEAYTGGVHEWILRRTRESPYANSNFFGVCTEKVRTAVSAAPGDWNSDSRAYMRDDGRFAAFGSSPTGASDLKIMQESSDISKVGAEVHIKLDFNACRLSFRKPSGSTISVEAVPCVPLYLFITLYRDGNGWEVVRYDFSLKKEETSGQEEYRRSTHDMNCCTFLFGNPGVGKSTLGNGLAKQNVFRSGQSCTGLTKDICVHVDGEGNEIIDLPGLADPVPQRRKINAEIISKALRQNAGKRCRIIFIVKQDHGRIRADDRTTMSLILGALPSISINFGVIVNECHSDIMKLQGDGVWKTEFANLIHRGLPCSPDQTPHIHFARFHDEWLGENKVPQFSKGLTEFFESLPFVSWPPEQVTDIMNCTFDELRQHMITTEQENDRLMKAKAAAEETVRQQELSARKNFWILLAFLLALPPLFYPAIATTFGIHGWDSRKFATLTLPNGHKLPLLSGLVPYYTAFLAYKSFVTFQAFQADAVSLESEFELRGNSVQVVCLGSTVKRWHVWICSQFLDAAGDIGTLLSVWSLAEHWIPLAWGWTTLVSILLPSCYAASLIRYQWALVLQGIFEDSWQALIMFVLVMSTSDAIIPLPLISSAISSFLGLIELAGITRAWMRDAGFDYRPISRASREIQFV